VVWDGQGAFPDVQEVETVLALWGAVPPAADLSLNTTLALRAIDLAEHLGVERVLLCSSAAVYPKSDAPHEEDGPVAPFSDYGRSKLEMEQAVARCDGPVQTCCMRIGNVFGADSLYPALIKGAVTLDRFEDGKGPLRSYVSAADLAYAVFALENCASLPACINIASHPAVYMEEFIKTDRIELSWREAPASATAKVVLDLARLHSITPLPPASVNEMIAQTKFLRHPK
jgi:nucleoside-diphosphate-sugar epimerase